MTDYYIYKHTNKSNGKCYIGQTKNIKWRWYPNSYKTCSKFYRAILKYGWNNFTHEIIEVCDETNVDYWETYYIKQFDSVKNGYNLDSGGCKNKVQSMETIQKKIENNKKRVYKKGTTPWNKGLKLSEEYRLKLSIAHKGQGLGRKLTDKLKEKIKKSNLGQKRSVETRKNLSLAHLGKESNHKKQVINLDTGEVFESLTRAGMKYNLSIKNISANIHKKSKSCGGYHWAIYEPHLKELRFN